MAYFTIEDYLSIGMIEDLTRTVWEVATDKDFINIINRTIKTTGDLLTCHMALQKEDGSWYDERDILYVRVKIYSKNGASPWYLVNPDKSYLTPIWINTDDVDINGIKKERVGIVSTDGNGNPVSDFIDKNRIDELLKEKRKEEYREDY